MAFFCSKKKRDQGRFFDKNHGLTPLQNVVFFRLSENFIFRSKKLYVLSRISKNVSLLLFPQEKIYKKKVDFLTKTMDKPLSKMSIFSTFWELKFSGLKSILFYPQYQKIFLSGFFCSRKHMKKRSIFWQKPGTNPFAKCRFFLEFFLKFSFVV